MDYESMRRSTHSRRRFLKQSAALASAAFAAPYFVPSSAFGANDKLVTGHIGVGGQGRSNLGGFGSQVAAVCDVDKQRVEGAVKRTGAEGYSDYRKLLERDDIDAVVVSTPDHWHAICTIHACMSGKHVYCEKPLSLTIHEGRQMVEAARKYKRIVQTGSQQRSAGNFRQACEYVRSGRIGKLEKVLVGIAGANHPGKLPPDSDPPAHLDYDFWLGPAPYKPYNADRVHYKNRFYWDYEGGDLANFGAHSVDPFQWSYGKDDTSPVRIEPHAPWPQHPDAVGQYGWVECTYEDGLRVVITGGGWGEKYDRPGKSGMLSAGDLDEAARKKLAELPDPEPLVGFGEAVRTRKQAGGGAESSHRVSTVLNLANIAIRVGRTIHYDPVKEQIVGDEEANRFVNIPMRPPWRLPT